jgi:hypothetical protein
MNRKSILLVLFILICFAVNAQNKSDSLRLQFKVKFNNNPIELNKKYVTLNKDIITLDNFKCYISSVQIHYSDKTIFTQKDSYHLLAIDNSNSLSIPITKASNKVITKVSFEVGIDSLTSTSGIHNGVLDPINGMYWAWQSGYINFKIEGKSPSCNTRQNKFQFHIGGYLHPNYALRTINLFPKKENPTIDIAIDLARFFDEIHLDTNNTLMIPSSKAMELADLSIKLFQLE